MINTLLNFLAPLAQLYLLWRILRAVGVAAQESERKRELRDTIKKFGAMFAEAADLTPSKKKRLVQFEAEADE